jgi:hypothetical protein
VPCSFKIRSRSRRSAARSAAASLACSSRRRSASCNSSVQGLREHMRRGDDAMLALQVTAACMARGEQVRCTALSAAHAPMGVLQQATGVQAVLHAVGKRDLRQVRQPTCAACSCSRAWLAAASAAASCASKKPCGCPASCSCECSFSTAACALISLPAADAAMHGHH